MVADVSSATINHDPPLHRNNERPSGSDAWTSKKLTKPADEDRARGHEHTLEQEQRQDRSQSNPPVNLKSSPLAIPEILQEICSYLHGLALVRACRVSKDFFECCKPLLWTSIPESAWDNVSFCQNWIKHASQIRSLRCGPGASLDRIALYCHDLVSLDVSRMSTERATITLSDSRSTETDRIRVDSPSDITAKSTITKTKAATTNASRSKDNFTALADNINESSRTTDSFEAMTDGLARVIQSNKNLRCLQLRPYGRFPSRLLDALSRLDRLEILSLNGWQDFQEYSLQLILTSCRRLSHLSLGENDFTRFTLDTLACSDSSSYPKGVKTVIRLEPFDDPIKGTNGRHYVDQDMVSIQSKRAVRYLSSPPLNLEPGLPHQPLLYADQQHHLGQYQLSTSPQSDQFFTAQTRIKTLSLHQSGLRQEFLVNLVRQCPQLEHLSLIDGWGFYPSSKFASKLAECCPQLSRLEFREQALDLQDEFFVSLCRHFPRLEWIHAGKTGFSQRALESVSLFCREIVSINLDGTRGIQSKTMDSVLRTCPSLKTVRALGVVLNGRDLCKDRPWVCSGLENLVIDIEIYAAVPINGSNGQDAETVEEVRARVYRQLAALSRMQCLGIGGGHRVGGKEPGADLTLESGLGRLSTLLCLERLDLRRLVQNLGQEEVAWMVDHWPRLQHVEVSYANRGTHKDRYNKALQWLAQARPGIELSLYSLKLLFGCCPCKKTGLSFAASHSSRDFLFQFTLHFLTHKMVGSPLFPPIPNTSANVQPFRTLAPSLSPLFLLFPPFARLVSHSPHSFTLLYSTLRPGSV